MHMVQFPRTLSLIQNRGECVVENREGGYHPFPPVGVLKKDSTYRKGGHEATISPWAYRKKSLSALLTD